MKTLETMIASFDGTQLRMRSDIPGNAKAAVVIVHGLAEHLNRYDHVAEKLTADGMAVYRFDHRGHGKSGGQKTYFSDFNVMPDDTKVVVDIAKKEHQGKPVFLLGHSMGGFTVTAFGTKYPGNVSGIITSGALTRYNKKIMGDLPINLPEDTYFPNNLADGVCSDQDVIDAYTNDPLVMKEISVGLLNSIYHGVEWLKKNPSRMVDPVLILHGCRDGLVSEKDSRDLYGDIASEDKTLKIYPFLFHEILNEPCRDEIIAEAAQWINKRL